MATLPGMAERVALDAESALEFLLERGLVVMRDVVEGDLSIEETHGRNVNLQVRSRTGADYFLKQALGDDSLLGVEAAFHACVAIEDRWERLRRWLPNLRSFESDRGVLVFHRSTARDVFELDGKDPLGLPAIGTLLGEALAACHDVPLSSETAPAFLDRSLPWPLAIDLPSPASLADSWSSQIELLRALQSDATVRPTLERLTKGWTPSALVHGDLKFTNVLVETHADGLQPSGLLLIDWETAMYGDPAWDIGSVLQAYLWYAVYRVSLDETTSAATAPQAFGRRLPAFQREMRAFWETYVKARELSPDAAAAVKRRSVSYAGVRLLQTAWELAQGEERPGRLTSGALQLGLNVLRSPDDAAVRLMGLPALSTLV